MHFGYINGPEEGIFSLCFASLLPCFFGVELIKAPFKHYFGLSQFTFLPEWQTNETVCLILDGAITLSCLEM